MHLCLNAGLDGARRLRSLIDIDTVVGSGRVDLDAFADRSDRLQVSRLCSAVLQRSRNVLGTDLPGGFIAALSPSRSWIVANDAIDRVGLRSQRRAGIASGRLIAAGRPSARATAAALGRTLQTKALERVGKKSLGQVGGELDWQRRPRDGDIDAHRCRYMHFVSEQDRQLRRTRCLNVDELHRRIGDLQPRTTPMLGAALLAGLRGRRARADLFEFADGTLADSRMMFLVSKTSRACSAMTSGSNSV